MAISLTESFPRASASLGDRIHALTHQHHGTGLVILNREATHLLVVEEIKPKQASERRIGQYSPPLETAKRGM
ncbi:MAG TPA: hypothetical protein VFQ63_02280, partial [Patescibacteria group bacterium]|nr:hypothetical protein [Patescibacteria group bacterium]